MKKGNAAIVAAFIAIAAITAALAVVSVPLALGAGVALIALVLVIGRPFFGLILYLVLLYVRPQDFIPQLEKARIALSLAGLILVSFFTFKVVRRERISFLASRQHLLVFALLAIVPLSNLVNFRIGSAWDGFNIFLTVFLLFYLIASIADDFRRFRTVCWTLVASTAAICVNALIQKFRGYDLVGQETILGRVHWIGLFGDPNDFALLVNSMLPFVLVNLFDRGARVVAKIGLAIVGALFVVTIYYTNSRGGFVALLLILLVFSLRRWGVVKGLALGAVFLVLGLLFSPSRVGDMNPYEMSASGRVYAWIGGLVMLKSRPLLGVGFGNFELFHERAAHSAYIQCVAELGLLGYFAWIALIYTSLADLRRAERFAESAYARYAPIVEMSMVGFCGSAIFLSQAYSPVLYIIAALAVLVARGAGASAGRPILMTPREALTVAALVAASLVGYKILAMLYV